MPADLSTKKELEKFLKNRGVARKVYLTILRGLSMKDMRWSEVKDFLTIKLKRGFTDPKIKKYLSSLEDYGFISKDREGYKIDDPLLVSLFRRTGRK